MIFRRGKESTGGVAPSSMTKDHFSISAYSLSIYSESMVFVRMPNTMKSQLLLWDSQIFWSHREAQSSPVLICGKLKLHFGFTDAPRELVILLLYRFG